ncbi:hypothetical protein, partial [Bacillus velezensis]|uniref:hypothetical protein n=1 Tax=Bacillus velezensis TaxID=492670 RepID=UPI002DB79E7F
LGIPPYRHLIIYHMTQISVKRFFIFFISFLKQLFRQLYYHTKVLRPIQPQYAIRAGKHNKNQE